MDAVVLVGTGKGQVELRNFAISDPAEDEIQVEIRASLVSPGTERSLVFDTRDQPVHYPIAPGYSSAGIVKKIGSKVEGFSVGDRVAGHGISHRSVGNISADRVVTVPDGIPFEQAAFLAMGVIALQGVRKARIELGEDVMILGMGLVGQLAAQLAAMDGALPTIGVDLDGSKLEKASQCGTQVVINASESDWKEKLSEVTEGNGPKIVIECTGFPEAIEISFQTVQRFGRVILLGSTRGESTINFYRDVHLRGITIAGAHISTNAERESRSGVWTWQDDANTFIKLLQRNRIVFEPLITETIQWEHAAEVYVDMLSSHKSIIGTVIQW